MGSSTPRRTYHRITRARRGGKPCFRPRLPWWALASVVLLAAASIRAAELPEIQAQTADILRLQAQVEASAEGRSAQSIPLEQRLLTDSANLIAPDITAATLRRARLSLDEARSRLAALREQHTRQGYTLAGLRAQVQALDQAIAASTGDRLADLSREARRRLLGVQADATRELMSAMVRLIAVEQDAVARADAYLELLHARVRPAIMDWAAGLVLDPRLALIDTVRAELLHGSLGVGAEPPGDAQARDAAARAQLRGLDLELLGIAHRLDAIAALREDPDMPTRALDAGTDALTAVQRDLLDVQDALLRARSSVASRRTLLRADGPEDPGPEWVMTDDLQALIELFESDVTRLLGQTEQELDRFSEGVERADRAAWMTPDPLPGDGIGWRRAGASLMGLPGRTAREWSNPPSAVSKRIDAMGAMHWGLLATAALLISWGLLWSGRRLAAGLEPLAPEAGRALTWVLPGAVPAAVWALVGTRLDLPADRLMPVLVALLLWSGVALVLGLVRLGFPVVGTPAPNSASYRAFDRRLRWALIGAALLTAPGILAEALPLGPVTETLIHRLAMIGPILLAVPAFGLGTRIIRGDRGHSRIRGAVATVLSRSLPVALLGIGIIGIAGYTRLAQALAVDLLWLAGAGLGLYLAIRATPLTWHTGLVTSHSPTGH